MFWFLAGFLALVLFRLGYGYVAYPNGQVLYETSGIYRQLEGGTFSFEQKNYAGQKQSLTPGAVSVDQRYEKIAALGLASHDFETDERRARGVAEAAGALIQYEQAFGLNGNRRLQLGLGVPPESFDTVIAALRDIGRLLSFQVDKLDKTNEYRALLAQRDSLEKSRDSLLGLKQREAALDDLIELETSILGLERQIQDLGVAVGEFDSEFEFVTVKLSLSEVAGPQIRNDGFLARLKTALEWAVLRYLMLNVALLCLVGTIALGVFVVGKLPQDMTARIRKG